MSQKYIIIDIQQQQYLVPGLVEFVDLPEVVDLERLHLTYPQVVSEQIMKKKKTPNEA